LLFSRSRSRNRRDARSPRQLRELEIVPTRRWRPWRTISAPRLLVGSFMLLVALGTMGLRWLPGLYTGERLGWLDALFTATSAVCVTGLIVVDTATFFTPAGQAFILLLIQLGGLGIIAFTSLVIVALGRRMSLRHETLGGASTAIAPEVDPGELAYAVVRFTLLIEAAGAVLLYLLWIPRMGWRGAAFPALFHAVSAFCNAGFSTFSDSLIGFQRAPLTLLVIMALIVAGGLGFLTMEELSLDRRARREGRRFRVSLHSRIVLWTTGVLLVGGWIVFTVLEWHGTFGGLPAWARVLNGLFMSVTARTAGFNSVDYGQVAASAAFVTILLMAIGGSPGSTAGGMKTTTFALLGLLAVSRLRGREMTSLFGRTVPEETIQRAVGLFVIVFGTITTGILAFVTLQDTRGERFLHWMFEAASAFNTVGLSMGVTADMSPGSRVVAIFLMYVGRVGPLAFAAAITLSRPTPEGEFRYAYEDVVIG
jgi:trk system potassium uptake protein TrkH